MGIKILIGLFILVNLQGMPTAKKISELDFAATLVNANEIELEQSGNSVSRIFRDSHVVKVVLYNIRTGKKQRSGSVYCQEEKAYLGIYRAVSVDLPSAAAQWNGIAAGVLH